MTWVHQQTQARKANRTERVVVCTVEEIPMTLMGYVVLTSDRWQRHQADPVLSLRGQEALFALLPGVLLVGQLDRLPVAISHHPDCRHDCCRIYQGSGAVLFSSGLESTYLASWSWSSPCRRANCRRRGRRIGRCSGSESGDCCAVEDAKCSKLSFFQQLFTL